MEDELNADHRDDSLREDLGAPEPSKESRVAGTDSPRGHWPLARVTQVLPGSEGRARTVQIKTTTGGTYTRFITKVALLEAAEASQQFRN